ncbi:hypothetical protein GCM10009565_14760 [Amycolatopsis albidoflavus]
MGRKELVRELELEVDRLKEVYDKEIRRDRRLSRAHDRLGFFLIPLVVLAVLLNLASAPFWLPVEVFQVKGEPKRVVSVLESANGELVVYYLNTTRVMRVKQGDVIFRQICDQRPGVYQKTVVFAISDGQKTPACP